ncbi:MAG: glycoside hydrolase family 48 protein, partial [Terracidiphilus sp.]
MIQQFNSSRVQTSARRLSLYLAVLAALLLTLVSPGARAQAACNIGYTITSQWAGGFGAALTINNTGTTSLSSWTLTWSFANGQTIPAGSVWNGNVTQSGANVILTNLSYDGAIPAGGSLTSVGFNGTWNNVANAIPANFALNGVACNGVKAQGFSVAAAPASLPLTIGKSATDTVTVTPSGGFTGAVTLTNSTLPTGITVTYGTNPATATSVLTFTAASNTVAGSYPITITGTSGTLTPATTTITLVVSGAGGFTLAASPAALTVIQNASAADTISIADISPFSGNVTLSYSTLPTGVTATFGTNPATVSSVLTFKASQTATTGTYPITITGVSGANTATTLISLTVLPLNTCVPTAITPYLQVNGGAWQQISTVNVPAAATVNLGPQPIGGTWSWTGPGGYTASTRQINAIPLTAGLNVYTATYTNAANCPSTQAFNITEAGGSFTLAPAAVSLTVAQGASGTDNILITDSVGFTGSVTLTATGQPTGVAVGFGVNPATATSLATFTVASSVAAGSYPISINGVSGSSSAATSITLIVTPVSNNGFTLSASPATVDVVVGKSGASTIKVTDLGTFTGSVALAATGQPAGVTPTFAPTSTTGTSTLTLAVAATTVTGTYPIVITGISGTLTPATTSVSLVVEPSTIGCTGTLCTLYKGYFQELYAGFHNAANGYFSPQGVPYHSVETLIVEAPDYGHETVSETYSYYIWLEALEGNFLGNYSSMQTAWNSFAANMIPTAYQPTASGYTPGTPATYGPTWDSPSDYPSQLNASVPVGQDPIANELHTTYNTWEIYGAHWIIDSDNWYGYGQQEDGTSKPSCLNSYQRGPQESVWLTVPQPCWDNFKWGDTSNGGYLSLFTSGPYTPQWKYTDAPDADARAIQAVYWAQQYASTQGAAAVSQVATLTPLASELGDYLRYSFFDKYFKVQGCQSLNCAGDTGKKESSAYLLSWYYAWGGALPADGNWAWRIGSSDVHFGYQNPLAAYALTTTLAPASPTAKTDWTTGLERQLEFYR